MRKQLNHRQPEHSHLTPSSNSLATKSSPDFRNSIDMKLAIILTSIFTALAAAAPALDERTYYKTCQECQLDALACIKAAGSLTIANLPKYQKCQKDLDKCKKDADKSTAPVSDSVISFERDANVMQCSK